MTDTQRPTPAHGVSTPSTPSAKDKAADAAATGKQAAGEVAQTATTAAKDVAQETASQARQLAGKTTQEVTDQASVQKSSLVDNLRSLGDQLAGMTEHVDTDGVAVEAAAKLRDHSRNAADWLDGREPAEVLDGIRDLGRRRPAAYLFGALAAGVVAGRLTRGVVAVHTDDPSPKNDSDETMSTYARPSAQPTPAVPGGRHETRTPTPDGLYSGSALDGRTRPGTIS